MYEFENGFAKEDCKVDIKTRLTPKSKVCRRTVSKQIVSEAEYKSLPAPSDVRVTYLSDEKGTKSQVMDLGGGKARYVLGMGVALLLIILSLKFWHGFIRAVRKDADFNPHPET